MPSSLLFLSCNVQADAEHIWYALDLTTEAATAWMGFGLSEAGGMRVCCVPTRQLQSHPCRIGRVQC
jgi:hypothetical protein